MISFFQNNSTDFYFLREKEDFHFRLFLTCRHFIKQVISEVLVCQKKREIGHAFGNGFEAWRLYSEAFSGRNLPDHRTFNIVQRLRENRGRTGVAKEPTKH